MSQAVEPILAENKDRFVIFPIQHHNLWEWYKKSEASMWTAEEIDLHQDITDWTSKLNDDELEEFGTTMHDHFMDYMKESINEDKADAARWFGNLKYFYQKAFRELQGEDRETYKQLAKDFFSKLEIDDKVRPVGLDEDEGTLNKIADMLSRKFDDLNFDVNTTADRIDVRGSQQDLANFGSKLGGKKVGEYEVFATDDDDRGEIVRIVKSDSISRG